MFHYITEISAMIHLLGRLHNDPTMLSIYSDNQEKSILNVLPTGVFYLLGDKQVFQFK